LIIKYYSDARGFFATDMGCGRMLADHMSMAENAIHLAKNIERPGVSLANRPHWTVFSRPYRL
jgi:hypothetical protein